MHNIIFVGLLLMGNLGSSAQKISYSEVDRDDYREMNFEIIGKMGSNINIYKNYKNRHDISIYDNEMQLKNRVKFDFMPERVFTVDFVSYGDFAYMLYQYQKRNIVSYAMVKINQEGKLMTDPVDLDTSHASGSNDSKVYTMITSDDKKKILLFKIRRMNDRNFQITTMLYNQDMQLLKRSSFYFNLPDKDGVFTDFVVDNDGDLVFGRCSRSGSREFINKVDLMFKPALSDSLEHIPITLNDKTLDEVKLKFDNYNKRLIVNSLFYQQRRGNVEGLYALVWDKKQHALLSESSLMFDDSLRFDAKGDDGSIKTAFNDYFIRDVLPLQDGSYAVAAELFYSSSRNNAWNRFDYLYGGYGGFISPYDMWYNYPISRMYGMGWYDPFNRFGPQNNIVRYVSENIMVFLFNEQGKLKWSNTIRKSQYDDNNDSFLSYQLFNTGSEARFLFNQRERRDLFLNSATIDADGKLKRQPTMKNLDRNYDFMPKFGKQIGLRQVIIPCVYKNYICFAKLEL
ncbi:MAG: hypothetical protein FJX83_01865 [Bacteroidetes bacterium]|nr:hypothetical protein [Bacteroidota bacterium]